MPNEIEAKMKVPSHAPVRDRLRALGATFHANTLETNHFFDTPTASLKDAGKGLRLRINHDLATNTDQAVITFKGPRQPGQFKIREELETVVSEPANTIAIFQALGFAETARFQKRRESWTLNDLKIELDELPHLGCFVEIEGHDEASIQSLRDRLGLADTPTITDAYVGLLMRHAESLPAVSGPRIITFPLPVK